MLGFDNRQVLCCSYYTVYFEKKNYKVKTDTVILGNKERESEKDEVKDPQMVPVSAVIGL